ncbi:unnamed protein product [Moneuplotes crassus]|uniref:Putative rRNA methyltransferase n=2 Tax=Euplotes crassus TaxID=5936 RepID=A0AAD1Y0Y0_EUPCR|nr:unnamed protein product [Moneuplotes crassus]
MGKKEKAKDRLDKYYIMAKEHNYRSRAAFKLIQLNRKYNFLSKSKVLIDLCAAPGGWLQIAAKYMPISSIKIGIDLDPIPHVKGCVTFQCDITTPKCISLIKKEIKHFEADVVLNDGAPNVGAQWSKDAYGQAELVLAACKLATQVLKKGGTFVTKVFRSKDYNALIWAFNHLFKKVEPFKPAASRSNSAETFLVCLEYKKPDHIDPKILDPKHIFEDIDTLEEGSKKKINSLKKLLEQKHSRIGYDDLDGSGAFYKEEKLSVFMKSLEPYKFLTKCHRFVIDEECKEEIFNVVKPPASLESIVDDLKVLGRSDLTLLLKYRSKYLRQVQKRRAKENKERKLAEEKPLTKEEIEKENEEALEKALQEKKKQAMKKERKQNEIQKKSEYLQKMSIMTSVNVMNNDDEISFDPRTFAKLQQVENLDELHDSDASSELDEEQKKELAKQQEYEDMLQDNELDEYDSDYEKEKTLKMDEEMENRMKEHKEYQLDTSNLDREEKIVKKKIAKGKRNLEMQFENTANFEVTKYNNKDVQEQDSEELSSDEDELAAIKAIEVQNKKRVKTSEDNEFINPLVATKKDLKRFKKSLENKEVKESDAESFDSDVEELADKMDKEKQEEKEMKKKRNLKKLQKMEEEVGAKTFEEVKAEKTYSDYDSDEIAEIRAIGKRMLRKKERLDMIDASYSRYAYKEDPSELPTWFAEEEEKFNKPIPPVTKEEIQMEKKFMKEYNARPSAKLAEYKERKKRKMARAMQKVKQKANQIANSDEFNDVSKMRQIKRMYSQEKRKLNEQFRQKKETIVGRTFSTSAPGKTAGRKYKMVDSRMKKDTRAEKRATKKKKGTGKRIKMRK